MEKHDGLRSSLRATLKVHGVENDDLLEELHRTVMIFINMWREHAREDADGDWRAVIKTLSAHRPTYVMTYPRTVLDRAEELVQSLRDDKPMDPHEGEHPLDTKERHSDDAR